MNTNQQPDWLTNIQRYSPELPNGFYWLRVGDLLIVTRVIDPGQIYAVCRHEQGLPCLFRRFKKIWADASADVHRGVW